MKIKINRVEVADMKNDFTLKVVICILVSIFAIEIGLCGLCGLYFAFPHTLLLGYNLIEGLKYDPSQEPKPEITYGEFPLELTYKVDDELITVTDVLVCEYYSYDETLDLIHWNEVMKSTNEMGFVLYDKGGVKITCRLGRAEYYMGEEGQEEPQPIISKEIKWIGSSSLTEKELKETYGIELISWKTAPPIENFFDFRITQSE